MQQLPNINIREQAKKQLIDDSLIANVEDFRSQATKAFNDYTVRQRTIIYQLGAKNIDSYGVLTAWQDELLPKQQSLRKKRSDDAFSKLLTKNLLLKNNEIESKVDHIIQERETEILNNFIEKIYPIATDNDSNKYTDQRQQATDLLSKPETEINEILNHYIDYLLYKEIADENHISVNDPHSSPIKRLISNSRIRSERKKTVIYQNERLIFIKNRLELLSKMNGGLVANLYEKKWDLIIILGLRNQYDKKISKLSKDDETNAIKRLSIFDSETQQFKNEQIYKLLTRSDRMNLEATRLISKEIDTLLLRIFDLSNIQKNQLLMYSKEYRELIQEQATINKLQNK